MNRRGSTRWMALAATLALSVGATSWLVQGAYAQRKKAPAKQELDAGYTAKIREYTTEPFFLTELVDHLPASATVPSPEKVLGYVIGTPGKLTYTKDLYRYYRALAAATPRVKVWGVGKSEEGREFLLIAVSDEANLAKIDRLKQITAKLADPRQTTDAEAEQLVKEAKPIYWLSGSIHSPETGSPEMLMELAYRLAVEDSPLIERIRRNAVVLITPVLEVDGRDRMVDLYNYRKANPDKAWPSLLYWGKYVAHDNNRDGIGMALALSRQQMQNFLDWHPQVLHDLHESVPYLYTSTGTGPYNSWLDPIVVSEWQSLAYHEIEEMTKRGVPGIWTHGFYDGWAPNYMFYVANGHNSIGRFYETFGNGGADTRERTLPSSSTSRTWFRPNPPLTKVKWSMRNNINLQQSALLLAISYFADHGEEFLHNFYLKSKRAVAKATTEGPAAWVILNDGRRPALAASLARLLQQQGCEVHKLDQDFEVAPPAKPVEAKKHDEEKKTEEAKKGEEGKEMKKAEESKPVKIPAGSYIIRMDQPYSRMADMLLDTQYYSVNDPRPYDDTGWTMGAMRNVPTLRVTDTGILKAPMTLLKDRARAAGGLSGAADAKYFVIDASAEPALATLRFRLPDVKFFAAEDGFTAGGTSFHTGSFLIPAEGNPSNLRQNLETAAGDVGLRVHAIAEEIKVARHAVALPRIAVVHTWINTQNEGWYRLMLDREHVPYTYISDHTVAATPNLREKFDVILFPPVFGDVARLVQGIPKRILPDGSDAGGPIPWKNTPLTPNMGGPGDPDGPDQTDDLRGGLGYEGLANLKKFVEEGGLFIPTAASAELPIRTGMIDGVSVVETKQLQARGAVYNATVEDKRSPIAYGYDDKVALYFNQAPVLRVAISPGGGFGGLEFGPPTRPSGRGAMNEPDIPQGRPWNPPPPEPKRSKAEQELYVDPEVREFVRSVLPPPELYPRVILRFAEEKDLLVSGMLAGGSELAQTPAVVDVPLGRGHVVLFADNPMWRHETQGQFMLVLNAALNFDHLDAGRVLPKEEKGDSGGN